MTAWRFVRRNGWPLWYLLANAWLLLIDAPSWMFAFHGACAAGHWLCEREVNHLDAEISALKAEAVERTMRDLHVEGFSTPMRVPAEMSDQEVATILWLLSRGIEEAS